MTPEINKAVSKKYIAFPLNWVHGAFAYLADKANFANPVHSDCGELALAAPHELKEKTRKGKKGKDLQTPLGKLVHLQPDEENTTRATWGQPLKDTQV